MHIMHAPVPAAAGTAVRQTARHAEDNCGWSRCAKNMHDRILDMRLASPRAPASIAAVGLEGILSETSSPSSQKRQTSKKPKAKSIETSCSYRQNENAPPAFK